MLLVEILIYDWNKYNDIVVVIVGVDRVICMFDIRNLIGGLFFIF